MAKVIPFDPHASRAQAKKRTALDLKEKARGKTLCRSGHHKWTIDQKKQFDVKQGRLVTLRTCARCGKTKTTLD